MSKASNPPQSPTSGLFSYPDEQMICFCHGVKAGQIRQAIRDFRERTGERASPYDIQLETLAATGCGGCERELMELLEEL